MINADILKKPAVWAVAIPAILVLWMFFAAGAMLGAKTAAGQKTDSVRQVEKDTQDIQEILRQTGATLSGGSSNPFKGISSALLCAKAGQIPDLKISRGESSKPQEQKDGTVLHRETYKIDGVRLLQIVQFIDHAERNFYAVHCTQITLTASGGKSRDNWVANVTLEYTTK
jgi:hypothetical protein